MPVIFMKSGGTVTCTGYTIKDGVVKAMDCLVEAAAQIGLAPDIAAALVLQTMRGSTQLIEKSGKSPAELRRMVTSPGGTTAAALSQLEAGGFARLVSQAVAAAYARAKELGK